MAAWRSKPSWYAVSKLDQTISPDLERFLAARMKATTVELEEYLIVDGGKLAGTDAHSYSVGKTA